MKPNDSNNKFIDINHLQHQISNDNDASETLQKTMEDTALSSTKTPAEIRSFFSQLCDPNQNSIIFSKKGDKNALTKKNTYIICSRTKIEKLEVYQDKKKVSLIYHLDDQTFHKNNILQDDPQLFTPFFNTVFQIIKQAGKTVTIHIEPKKSNNTP